MGALVFVTTELSPFTSGGIGRVIHNILRSMSAQDRERSYVLALDCSISTAAFSALFPGAQLISLSSDFAEGRYDAAGHQPPRRAFSGTDLQWKSSVIFRALRRISKELNIDYVEFPDWGGLGFASIQEKRISGWLSSATLSVRLHSSHSLLLHHEASLVRNTDLIISDIERKCLRDCDLIVAQLGPVGEHNRKIFGFTPEEWDDRVVVHSPPVLLDHHSAASVSICPSVNMPIMFGSKLQRFKRPDLFVRGVASFCQRSEGFEGDALISAHSFDDGYRNRIVRMIPPGLSGRFHFDAPKQGVARERLIASSTFVAPSDFESFCLSAYEASLLGARVVLNGANPGFGDGTPWQHGVNCLKFDGTTAGLVDALDANFAGVDLIPVKLPHHPWPWEHSFAPKIHSHYSLTHRPLVSVLIPHFNLGDYVISTIMSVLEQTYDNIEILVIDDGSFEPQSLSVINDLASRNDDRLKVLRAPGNVGLSGARNIGLSRAIGEYILPLDADDLIHPRFIEVAVEALQSNPEFDVFVTPAAYFQDGSNLVLPGEEVDFPDYAVFVGEALISGVRENKFSTATALFRAYEIKHYGYVESLSSYEDWNLYLRMAYAGCRFLVSNDVYFYYRNRAGSMIKEANDPLRHALFLHDNLRTAVDAKRMLPLSYIAFHTATSDAAHVLNAADASSVQARNTQWDGILDLVAASLVRGISERARPRGMRLLFELKDRLRGKGGLARDERLIMASDLFDAKWYLQAYPDVASAGLDPARHYIVHGAREGRDPGPFFSTLNYLAANPDVRGSGINPLVHYVAFGLKERRYMG